MMKIGHLLNSIVLMLMAFCIIGCNSDEDNNDYSALSRISLKLDVTLDKFDSPMIKVKQKSAIYKWEDNSTVYVRFHINDKYVTGKIVYKETEGWLLDLPYIFNEDETGSCEAYYFENSNISQDSNPELDSYSECYECKDGTFCYNKGTKTCAISLILRPCTSRIRFKGDSKIGFSIKGLSTPKNFNLKDWNIEFDNKDIDRTINDNGFSNYVYANWDVLGNHELIIYYSGYTYETKCASSILEVGKSGYMELPTFDKHSGWEIECTPDLSGAIDLGLSSKWAACNIGAKSPEEVGNYYSWGECKEKNLYNSNTYTYYHNYAYTDLGSCIANTKYDVAHAILGENWQMPNFNDIVELQNCKWTKTKYHNKECFLVRGPNGNYIIVPIGGYVVGDLINNINSAFLWTDHADKSYTTGSEAFCIEISGNSSVITPHIYSRNRAYGIPVRAVLK